jgi:hypothetical protein
MLVCLKLEMIRPSVAELAEPTSLVHASHGLHSRLGFCSCQRNVGVILSLMANGETRGYHYGSDRGRRGDKWTTAMNIIILTQENPSTVSKKPEQCAIGRG